MQTCQALEVKISQFTAAPSSPKIGASPCRHELGQRSWYTHTWRMGPFDVRSTVRHSPWHKKKTPAAHGVTGQVFARIDLSKRCGFLPLITLIHWVSQGGDVSRAPPTTKVTKSTAIWIRSSFYQFFMQRIEDMSWRLTWTLCSLQQWVPGYTLWSNSWQTNASATKLRKGAKWTSVSLPPWWVQAASSGWDIQSLLRWPFVSASESKKTCPTVYGKRILYGWWSLSATRESNTSKMRPPFALPAPFSVAPSVDAAFCARGIWGKANSKLWRTIPFPQFVLVNLQQLYMVAINSMDISENRATPKLSRAKLQILW